MNTRTRIAAVVAAVTAMVALSATAAYAASDPLSGVTTQVNTAKADLISWVTTVGIPVIFGLLVLGVGIALGSKFLRRGARSA